MRISDWSSDVCSSDLSRRGEVGRSDQACGIVGVIGLGVAERPEQECVLKTALGTKRIEIDPCRGRNRNAAEVAGLRHKRIIRFKFRLEREIVRNGNRRSEEHTSELQSLMRISYAV